MKYQIEHPELANALYLALKKDAFYQFIEKNIADNSDNLQEVMIAYMDYSIIEAKSFGECFIPKEQSYGVSIWSKPIGLEEEKRKKHLKNEFIKNNMGEKAFQLYDEVCRFMAEKSSELIEQSAWYLSIIGILPDFQGQGLGPGLVRAVLDKTDELGVATYLETFTPRNMTFYQRLGYQSVASFREPLTNAEYWLMQRAAM